MMDDALARSLFDQICRMPTVDAHEHLHAEDMRVARKVDIFLLFHQDLFTQLIAVGMDAKKANALGIECAVDPKKAGPQEPDALSPDEKWDAIAPYMDLVRTCSCARPPLEALKRFFGEADLTKDNYARISARMQEHNRPGLFNRCLRDACNIVLVLNQNRTMWQNEMFKPILPEDNFIGMRDRAAIEALAKEVGGHVPDALPQFTEQMEALLTRRVREGMIGVKGHCYVYPPGDKQAASSAYQNILSGRGAGADQAALADQALDIWLDMVPISRVIAFGGDYWWAVENVYGALRQTQEIVATVLARRIRQGSFNEARALDIAKRWFHDNPRELYRV